MYPVQEARLNVEKRYKHFCLIVEVSLIQKTWTSVISTNLVRGVSLGIKVGVPLKSLSETIVSDC